NALAREKPFGEQYENLPEHQDLALGVLSGPSAFNRYRDLQLPPNMREVLFHSRIERLFGSPRFNAFITCHKPLNVRFRDNYEGETISLRVALSKREIPRALDRAVQEVAYLQEHPKDWAIIRGYLLREVAFVCRGPCPIPPEIHLTSLDDTAGGLHVDVSAVSEINLLWGPSPRGVDSSSACHFGNKVTLQRRAGLVTLPDGCRIIFKGELGITPQSRRMGLPNYNIGNGWAHEKPYPRNDARRHFPPGHRLLFGIKNFNTPPYAKRIPALVET
ncbi:MAG: hypothetical protein KDD53_09075, partial [Bdellovibrionales bacterium]|nr:hypothetical protein [Bdellovibrionales bacterium]